jgi:hypothetical protein
LLMLSVVNPPGQLWYMATYYRIYHINIGFFLCQNRSGTMEYVFRKSLPCGKNVVQAWILT